MKITVLIENTSTDGALCCEHGLSFFIEYMGRKILLDAGSTNALCNNARQLGVKLEEVELAVLSHGHYDHSGGFESFFKLNKTARLYMQKSAVNRYYSGNGGLHEIGIPDCVLENGGRFELLDGFKKLFDGVYLVPHSTFGLEKIGEKAKLYKSIDGEIVPDDFMHEQSLAFDTDRGLVIFNSCSHGGLINIVNEVKVACNGKNVCAYFGGLHLRGDANGVEVCIVDDDELDKICHFVQSEDISVYTMHCTGKVAAEKLKQRLGDRLTVLSTGNIVEF